MWVFPDLGGPKITTWWSSSGYTFLGYLVAYCFNTILSNYCFSLYFSELDSVSSFNVVSIVARFLEANTVRTTSGHMPDPGYLTGKYMGSSLPAF